MYLREGTLGNGSLDLQIAEGDVGTAQTVSLMRSLIDQGVRDADINRFALALLERVPAHDTMAEAKAMYQWVRKNIRFTGDIYNAETLRTAREILQVRAGDCDDINGVLLPTLLESVGIETRPITINADSGRPELYSHIYTEANIDGQWIPLDAASKHASFGKAPAVYWRKTAWDGEGGPEAMARYLEQDDGDGGVNWTAVAQMVTAGTVGAANIIKAENAPYAPTTIMPTSAIPTFGQTTGLTPVASATVTAGGSSGTATLLLGGGALLLLAFLFFRK